MHDKLMKLMMNKKKQGKEMSDSEQKAKMEALMGMKDMANEMMGDRLKGLKKVTVASPTEEGLETGLKTAQEMMMEKSEDEESSKGMSPQDAEMMGNESKDMHLDEILKMYNWDNPEKIDEIMTQLQAKKEELSQEA